MRSSEWDPPSDLLAWIAAILSMLGLIIVLAGSSLGALLFLAVWGLMAVVRADRCRQLVFRSPGLWLVPALALVSAIWSAAPGWTLRAAVQLILTVGVASLVAGLLRPREFVSAMSVALLLGAVLSLMFGRYGVDGVTSTTVFLGIFASKNTMALFMSFLVIFAAAVLIDRGQPAWLRLLATFSFLLSVPLLLKAHSVGALASTAVSFMVLPLTLAFARLRSRERILMLAGVAAFALPLAAVLAIVALNGLLDDTISSFITGVLGKDATLTGRTLLWRIALAEIEKHPFLGIGYSAFWQQGNLLAESIWRYFGINSRMGFHFHDTYLEIAVELGWVGVAAFVATLILAIERLFRLALADQTPATACLVAAVFCLTIRTVAEVDAPFPFAIGTFWLFAIAAYGADYARAVRSHSRPVSVPPLLWAGRPNAGA